MHPAEPPSPQCPFPGDTEEEVFDCIVNAEAPYPHFLSVQGLELIQKVTTAGCRAGRHHHPRGPGEAAARGPVPSVSTALAQLLQKCPEKRLGAGERDAEEIKTQPFFGVSGRAQWEARRDRVGCHCRHLRHLCPCPQTTDWQALLARAVQPPFAPTLCGPTDLRYFEGEFTGLPPALTPPDPRGPLTARQQAAFRDFDFVSERFLEP